MFRNIAYNSIMIDDAKLTADSPWCQSKCYSLAHCLTKMDHTRIADLNLIVDCILESEHMLLTSSAAKALEYTISF